MISATESKFKPDDTEGAPTEVNSLFVFKLRSFRTLDKYRKKTRRTDNSYVVHSLMKERVDCLMKDRYELTLKQNQLIHVYNTFRPFAKSLKVACYGIIPGKDGVYNIKI